MLTNTTGHTNSAFGAAALEDNTTGDQHTAIGGLALRCNTTANDNTAVGYKALHKNTTGSSNVGMGKLALNSNTTGGSNTATGEGASGGITTGDCNTSMGRVALGNAVAGDNNIAIGYVAGTDGVRNITSGSDNIVLGNNDSATAHIKIDWTVTSDLRDKMNIENVPYGLNFVNQLNPIKYNFKKSREDATSHGRKRFGFKAQEILALEGENPVLVDNEDTDNLKLTGAYLLPVLVNAIKELKAQNDSLKSRIETLES